MQVYRRQLLTEEMLSIIRRHTGAALFLWAGLVLSWKNSIWFMAVVLRKETTKPLQMLQSNAGHCKLLLELLNVIVQPAEVQALVYSK